MDLRGFASGTSSNNRSEEGGRAYQAFIRNGISKPVIGAANATAVAGGFELLMACDLIVASDQARFGLPEVKRALFPAGGGVFLSRRVPLAVAFELTLTGDYFDADRALSLGLVNRVTHRTRFLAPPSSSPVKIRGKRTTRGEGDQVAGTGRLAAPPGGSVGHAGAATWERLRQRGRQGGCHRLHREDATRCGEAADRSPATRGHPLRRGKPPA